MSGTTHVNFGIESIRLARRGCVRVWTVGACKAPMVEQRCGPPTGSRHSAVPRNPYSDFRFSAVHVRDLHDPPCGGALRESGPGQSGGRGWTRCRLSADSPLTASRAAYSLSASSVHGASRVGSSSSTTNASTISHLTARAFAPSLPSTTETLHRTAAPWRPAPACAWRPGHDHRSRG